MGICALVPGLLFSIQAFAQFDDCKDLIESVRVVADGKSVVSENTLEARVYYKIVARGTFKKEDIGFGDAQYAFNTKQDFSYSHCANSPSGLVYGIELNINGNTPKPPDWGPFNPKHIYTIEIAGRERKLSIRYADCRPVSNDGSIMIDIFKCPRREPIK